MRISVVASELPHPEGTAAGRDLWAWCEGIRKLGHDLDAWLWRIPDSTPNVPIPEWCRFEPVEIGSLWRAHFRGLIHPRHDARRGTWQPAQDAVAVADHICSFAAAAPFPRSVATFHYRTISDAIAMHRIGLSQIQTARSEWSAARQASVVLAYSERVAPAARNRARIVPIAYTPPEVPIPPVDRPVAALISDWSWAPNRRALSWLLSVWPTVRDLVPNARLLIAGRWLDRSALGPVPGVRALGEVGRSADVLSQAAVVAFPCPSSSGPKVKVLEALAHGLPVVTTPPGVEGLRVPDGAGAVVVARKQFALGLAQLLLDPERRAALGASGREAVICHHSPIAAARARIDAFAQAFKL